MKSSESTIEKGQKKIVVLGSTGSIGQSTLDVVRRFRERFAVVGLAAGKNLSVLCHQIEEFQPSVVCVRSEEEAKSLRSMLSTSGSRPKILCDVEGYCEIAATPEADTVVSAIVGAAGLLPTINAIRSGKNIALANKETLVIAGSIVTKEVDHFHVKLLPVDSEHNAIFQSLEGQNIKHLKRIILTASGGPFFRLDKSILSTVTPEEALKHPNWNMGSKITIDSATLMNKGLELIEAHWLFRVPSPSIEIHIHPESIVHSMVEYIDGSILGHLAVPDMRIPIAYALSYPDRLPLNLPSLDLFALKHLSFFPPDEDKFPCLKLAKEACIQDGTMPAVLNAANELAVEAFLNKRIGFCDIPKVIESVMNTHLRTHGNIPASSLDVILDVDKWAREATRILITKL